LLDKKQDIFNSAREIFYKKGFKETNIAEIAKQAGVAVGTFYNYYDSKEHIFFEVLMKENEKQKKSILESVELNSDDPVTLVTDLVAQNIDAMQENPILKEWNNVELVNKLERLFYENKGIENIGKFYEDVALNLIKKWKNEGTIRSDMDDEFILAILNSVHYADVHKADIGAQHFPQLIQYLIDFIMKGLTAPVMEK